MHIRFRGSIELYAAVPPCDVGKTASSAEAWEGCSAYLGIFPTRVMRVRKRYSVGGNLTWRSASSTGTFFYLRRAFHRYHAATYRPSRVRRVSCFICTLFMALIAAELQPLSTLRALNTL